MTICKNVKTARLKSKRRSLRSQENINLQEKLIEDPRINYRSTGVGFSPGPAESFMFGRGRGLQPGLDIFLFLSDKSPITEFFFWPNRILTKPVNTNIRHLLCISYPYRPRCRMQTSLNQAPEAWIRLAWNAGPYMGPEMQALWGMN